MSSFTPRPWQALPPASGYGHYWAVKAAADSKQGFAHVAMVKLEADASLIAAAPDLLAALQCYLALDNDLATDSADPDTEYSRWAECQVLAADALRKAGLQLPEWLTGAVTVAAERGP